MKTHHKHGDLYSISDLARETSAGARYMDQLGLLPARTILIGTRTYWNTTTYQQAIAIVNRNKENKPKNKLKEQD